MQRFTTFNRIPPAITGVKWLQLDLYSMMTVESAAEKPKNGSNRYRDFEAMQIL